MAESNSSEEGQNERVTTQTLQSDLPKSLNSDQAFARVCERDEWPWCIAEGSQQIIASLSSGGAALRSALLK